MLRAPGAMLSYSIGFESAPSNSCGNGVSLEEPGLNADSGGAACAILLIAKENITKQPIAFLINFFIFISFFAS